MLKTVLIFTLAVFPLSWFSFVTEPLTQVPQVTKRQGIENADALKPFFKQLAAIESHTRRHSLRIVQYGDSHTKADFFTGAVRRNLLRDFDTGSGYLVKRTAYSTGKERMSVYQPLGINGARAKRLREMCENPSFLQSVGQPKPDLIVIAYGTNEVTDGNWTIESYSQMLVEIIERLRSAAPGASFLIIGPPDRAVHGPGGWTPVRQMPSLLAAQRRAALLANSAFWSEYGAMGGESSVKDWVGRALAQPDHVHLTVTGYNKLAGLFYSDLMAAYRSPASDLSAPLSDLDLRVMRGVPVSTKDRP